MKNLFFMFSLVFALGSEKALSVEVENEAINTEDTEDEDVNTEDTENEDVNTEDVADQEDEILEVKTIGSLKKSVKDAYEYYCSVKNIKDSGYTSNIFVKQLYGNFRNGKKNTLKSEPKKKTTLKTKKRKKTNSKTKQKNINTSPEQARLQFRSLFHSYNENVADFLKKNVPGQASMIDNFIAEEKQLINEYIGKLKPVSSDDFPRIKFLLTEKMGAGMILSEEFCKKSVQLLQELKAKADERIQKLFGDLLATPDLSEEVKNEIEYVRELCKYYKISLVSVCTFQQMKNSINKPKQFTQEQFDTLNGHLQGIITAFKADQLNRFKIVSEGRAKDIGRRIKDFSREPNKEENERLEAFKNFIGMNNVRVVDAETLIQGYSQTQIGGRILEEKEKNRLLDLLKRTYEDKNDYDLLDNEIDKFLDEIDFDDGGDEEYGFARARFYATNPSVFENLLEKVRKIEDRISHFNTYTEFDNTSAKRLQIVSEFEQILQDLDALMDDEYFSEIEFKNEYKSWRDIIIPLGSPNPTFKSEFEFFKHEFEFFKHEFKSFQEELRSCEERISKCRNYIKMFRHYIFPENVNISAESVEHSVGNTDFSEKKGSEFKEFIRSALKYSVRCSEVYRGIVITFMAWSRCESVAPGSTKKKRGGFICSKNKTCKSDDKVKICFHQLVNACEHTLSETSDSVDATYFEFCDIIMHEIGHALTHNIVSNIRFSPSMDIASLGANVTRHKKASQTSPRFNMLTEDEKENARAISKDMRTKFRPANTVRMIRNSDAWAVRYLQYHNDVELFQILGLFSDGDTLYLNKLSDFALASASGKKVRISHCYAGDKSEKCVKFDLYGMNNYIKSITVEPEFYRKLLEVYGVSADKYMENAMYHEASLEGALVPYVAPKE